MRFYPHLARSMLAAALLMAGLATHAKVTRVAYSIDEQTGAASGLLVAWDDSRWRANLTDASGSHDGGYSQSGKRRVFTYDTPQVTFFSRWAQTCYRDQQVRREITQAVETRLGGTPRKGISNWVSLGTDTVLDGCQAGQVTPVGDPDQRPPIPWKHILLNATPPRPLVPGERWAGLIEGPHDATGQPPLRIAQDTAYVNASGTAFIMDTTGSVLPATLNSDGWLITTLPNGIERAYRRVAIHPKNGAETWLAGDLAQGRLAWVESWRMVRPQAGAGFSSQPEASRIWRKIDPTRIYDYHLYLDFRADLQLLDRVNKTLFGLPMSWAYAPEALHSYQFFYGADGPVGRRDLQWVPLARHGAQQWVMESRQEVNFLTGTVTQLIAPRVAWYTDRGEAGPTRPLLPP